jgi:hypothetical protein
MDNAPEQQPMQPDATAVGQLVAALTAANTVRYPRLQVRLDTMAQQLAAGDLKSMPQAVADLVTFVTSYKPIDPKMADFLKKYAQANMPILQQLQQMVGDAPQEKPEAAPKPMKPQLNVRKYGLYRFPFLQQDRLDFGDISLMKTIKQELNAGATHYKLWKDINGIPFLVNGYPDNAYSCVTRVLAAQAGKMLGLSCEEVFFGNLNGKPVTLTAFQEAVTLLENETFKFYPMAQNYEYQSEQKRAFYFLIQHWTAYAVVNGQVKERFERHFIDTKGDVFLSMHEMATFLTPQQMSPALMVRLTLNKLNYRPIRDLLVRVGDRDVADIIFSSIPQEMIEAHDELALGLNKPTFDQRRDAFDSNWERLKEAIQEFEGTFGT